MKATPIEDMTDLAMLSVGIQILTGVGTDSLYIPVVDFPVIDSNTDRLVGHFTFDEESEQVVFKPSKTEASW